LTYYDEKNRPQIKLDRELENGMGIAIGRLRKDSLSNIKFVSTSHNTIRGAAGGAILLAELLCAKDYI
jgi:aspartate-semialdehyde dehydrogenase